MENKKRRTRQQCEWYEPEGILFTCMLAKQHECHCIGPKCGFWQSYKDFKYHFIKKIYG